MTPIEALIDSIQHWEENLERVQNGGWVDASASSCACCNMFLGLACWGCPIFEKTRRRTCRGTPYYDVLKAEVAKPFSRQDYIAAVQAELDFLNQILKENQENDS